MEATINLNMTIDVGHWDISKTFRERVKEMPEVIPLLDFEKMPLLLENCDDDTLSIRDKLMNVYVDKMLDEVPLKHLFSINQPYTEDDVSNLINSIRESHKELKVFDEDYVKKLIRGVEFGVVLESDKVYCFKFKISVDLSQDPQKPIHAASHLFAVYRIICMLESAFWEEVKKNMKQSENNENCH